MMMLFILFVLFILSSSSTFSLASLQNTNYDDVKTTTTKAMLPQQQFVHSTTHMNNYKIKIHDDNDRNNNNEEDSLFWSFHEERKNQLTQPHQQQQGQYEQQIQIQQRYDRELQQSTNSNDNRICQILMNQLLPDVYYDSPSNNEYRYPIDICDCVRTSDRLIEQTDINPNTFETDTRVIPGSFAIMCQYNNDFRDNDSCYISSSCIKDVTYMDPTTATNITTNVCSTISTNYSYTENINNPIRSLLTESLDCIDYYNDNDNTLYNTQLCIRSTTSGSNNKKICEIQIGYGYYPKNCQSCDYVRCNNNNNNDNNNDYEISFDCSNIIGLYSYDPCEYIPYTNLPRPMLLFSNSTYSNTTNSFNEMFLEYPIYDPLLYIRKYDNQMNFNISTTSCLDDSTTNNDSMTMVPSSNSNNNNNNNNSITIVPSSDNSSSSSSLSPTPISTLTATTSTMTTLAPSISVSSNTSIAETSNSTPDNTSTTIITSSPIIPSSFTISPTTSPLLLRATTTTPNINTNNDTNTNNTTTTNKNNTSNTTTNANNANRNSTNDNTNNDTNNTSSNKDDPTSMTATIAPASSTSSSSSLYYSFHIIMTTSISSLLYVMMI